MLRSDSTCVNMPIKSDCLNSGDEDVQMVAILRENKVHLPHPEMKLQAGDRLMLITSPDAWGR
ncbi:MAG: TrkA C-terminal domain-containing protein [Thermodesulfobacteriota bacterium]